MAKRPVLWVKGTLRGSCVGKPHRKVGSSGLARWYKLELVDAVISDWTPVAGPPSTKPEGPAPFCQAKLRDARLSSRTPGGEDEELSLRELSVWDWTMRDQRESGGVSRSTLIGTVYAREVEGTRRPALPEGADRLDRWGFLALLAAVLTGSWLWWTCGPVTCGLWASVVVGSYASHRLRTRRRTPPSTLSQVLQGVLALALIVGVAGLVVGLADPAQANACGDLPSLAVLAAVGAVVAASLLTVSWHLPWTWVLWTLVVALWCGRSGADCGGVWLRQARDVVVGVTGKGGGPGREVLPLPPSARLGRQDAGSGLLGGDVGGGGSGRGGSGTGEGSGAGGDVGGSGSGRGGAGTGDGSGAGGDVGGSGNGQGGDGSGAGGDVGGSGNGRGDDGSGAGGDVGGSGAGRGGDGSGAGGDVGGSGNGQGGAGTGDGSGAGAGLGGSGNGRDGAGDRTGTRDGSGAGGDRSGTGRAGATPATGPQPGELEEDPEAAQEPRMSVGQALRDPKAFTDGATRITLPGTLLFMFDEEQLRPEAEPTLRQLAQLLRANPAQRVLLEGHADTIGGDQYNQVLSERRAEAVRRWLVDQAHLSPLQIDTVGYGNARPIVPPSKSPSAQQANRRVEVLALP